MKQLMKGRGARRFRTLYGDSPAHLLILLASFAVCAYAAVRLLDGDRLAIIVWFVGAALAHDLVLVPLYSGADRLLRRIVPRAGRDGRATDLQDDPGIATVNHIRVPALISLLLLLVYWPLVAQAPGRKFELTTALTPGVFLPRWLLITAALFAVSAILLALRRWRTRRSHRRASGSSHPSGR